MNSLQCVFIFLAGFVFGSAVVWLFLKQKTRIEYDRGVTSSLRDVAIIQEKLGAAERETALLRNRCSEFREDLSTKTDKISALELEISRKNVDLAQLSVKLTEDHRNMESKLAFINDSREQLKAEFQALARTIFEDGSQKFTDQNKTNIDGVLKPLKEQLADFKAKIEQVYVKEAEGRAALANEISHLKDLSLQVSQDATNLAVALKGENKTQGSWGELVLERVLELSGLEKGREYETQFHTQDADGNRFIPDAVAHLPQNRDVVIDSKVSLTHYEAFVSADSDDKRSESLKGHVQSLRRHIQSLSEKRYDQLPEIKSLDYVLMFLPVEAAYIVALKHEPNLFAEAFSKNIILVCPSTLLVTLKVIGFSWRVQDQTANAQVIAKKASDLFDKFCGFLVTMQDVGESIKKSEERYNMAMKALSTGKGNLIKRAAEFQKLGVKGNKSIPVDLLQSTEPDDDLQISEAS